MGFRRKTLTSPRLRKKKRSLLLRRTILGGFLAIAFFIGARQILNSEIFTIKSIEVIGANKISEDQIKAIVSSEIDTSKFGIFSKRNFLFIDTKNISDLIQKSFPDFSKVRATLAGLGSLVVEVVEREPYAKWCGNNDLKQCLIIDEKGFAFEKDKTQKATTTLNIFTESQPIYATQFLAEEKFSKLKQLIGYFGQNGFKINSVTFNGADYYLTTSNDLEIRIRSEEEPNSIITKLVSIMNDLKKENSETLINQIDLRYGNKVFLKRK